MIRIASAALLAASLIAPWAASAGDRSSPSAGGKVGTTAAEIEAFIREGSMPSPAVPYCDGDQVDSAEGEGLPDKAVLVSRPQS